MDDYEIVEAFKAFAGERTEFIACLIREDGRHFVSVNFNSCDVSVGMNITMEEVREPRNLLTRALGE